MDVLEKLSILTDAAKYDAACTSSGVRRGSRPGMIGNTSSSIAGCCHSFSADGRCITLQGADDQRVYLRLPLLR